MTVVVKMAMFRSIMNSKETPRSWCVVVAEKCNWVGQFKHRKYLYSESICLAVGLDYWYSRC